MENILSILESKSRNFLVIGDIILDRYYYGSVKRISPEAPVPILNYKYKKDILGGAANVASNLSAIGQQVYLMSVIGQDDEGSISLNLLRNNNINTSLIIQDKFRCTTIKTRLMSGNHQMFRIDNEITDDISSQIEKEFIFNLEKSIQHFDIILLSDYLKGLFSFKFTQAVINMAKKFNKKIIIDVKDKNINKYSGAYLLKPNLYELENMINFKITNDNELRNAMSILKHKTQCDMILTTKGSEGMTLLDNKNIFHNVKNTPKQVFDVTGAGDTAFAYIGLGIASELCEEDILRIANIASTIKVSKSGTAVVTVNEIKNELNYHVCCEKNVTISKLLEILEKYKNKKIVFTNGCFDILHMGHIKYLKEAKLKGDLLIVGLNSDNSVRRLKGLGRPINNEIDRIEMLQELNFVDYIIKFNEDTPYDIIAQIKPNIIVKGGDYNIEDVIGRDIVESYGGRVEIVKMVEGKSTTKIIKSIKDKDEK